MCRIATSGSAVTDSSAVTVRVRLVESIFNCGWPICCATAVMGRDSAIKAANTFARFMRNSLTGRTQRRQDRSTRPNCVFSERGNVGSVISCVLLPEVAKFGERGSDLTGIDGFCAETNTLFQIRAETRGHQSGCGVQ